MHEHENLNVVRDFLEAYGRRDLERMLGSLSDDVELVMPGTAGVVPYLGHHVGRDAVAQAFQSIADNEELVAFDEREALAKGNLVVVVGHESFRVKSSGQPASVDIVTVFELEGGKVMQAKMFFDAAPVEKAYRRAASPTAEARPS